MWSSVSSIAYSKPPFLFLAGVGISFESMNTWEVGTQDLEEITKVTD